MCPVILIRVIEPEPCSQCIDPEILNSGLKLAGDQGAKDARLVCQRCGFAFVAVRVGEGEWDVERRRFLWPVIRVALRALRVWFTHGRRPTDSELWP